MRCQRIVRETLVKGPVPGGAGVSVGGAGCTCVRDDLLVDKYRCGYNKGDCRPRKTTDCLDSLLGHTWKLLEVIDCIFRCIYMCVFLSCRRK